MALESSTNIEEDFNFEDEKSFDEVVFKIRYWNTTYTFGRIAELDKKGKLIKPDLQRSYVWKQEMASRLIDSILLGIPLPNFFIYKNEDESNDIIDGLQRIKTISSFINKCSLPGSKSEKPFRLSNSNYISSSWRGKTFDELTSDEQERLVDGEASIVFFEQRFPNSKEIAIKRHVFERINTGGVKLTPQEIRNALYPGKLNDDIKELAQQWSNREIRFSEMDFRKFKIDELILRILTMENIVSKGYIGLQKDENDNIVDTPISASIILKNQMDFFMEQNTRGYEKISLLRKALDFYYENYNDRNFIGKNKNNINSVYAETVFIILMRELDRGNKINLTSVNYEKIKTLTPEDKLPFTKQTTNTDNLKSRIEKFSSILKEEGDEKN